MQVLLTYSITVNNYPDNKLGLSCAKLKLNVELKLVTTSPGGGWVGGLKRNKCYSQLKLKL